MYSDAFDQSGQKRHFPAREYFEILFLVRSSEDLFENLPGYINLPRDYLVVTAKPPKDDARYVDLSIRSDEEDQMPAHLSLWLPIFQSVNSLRKISADRKGYLSQNLLTQSVRHE